MHAHVEADEEIEVLTISVLKRKKVKQNLGEGKIIIQLDFSDYRGDII